jgi:ATP phosphoribosyltransferase regulatory subunit
MLDNDPWLLPDGIEEVLPDEARYLESLRRKLLDVFASWGYQFVIPPFIDYIESLLTGSGHDLDLQTFKLTDQISGKLLGIRADMTPLVARIDVHHLRHDWPTRLCYAGDILHTRGNHLEKNRCPMQIGAELYGHSGIASDIEVILLMLEMLAMAGLKNVHLDLGHVGIYRELSLQAGLSEQQEADLFDVLQRKARTELVELMESFSLDNATKSMFLKLPELNGNQDVLRTSQQIFAQASDAVCEALTDLIYLADQLKVTFPSLPISFDLAELRGYHYHTGIVFAAFVPSLGREIARGGRYDNIGQVFGRSRPATGFSADLKCLSALAKIESPEPTQEKTFAPAIDDPELLELVRDMRAQGKIVIQQLPGQSGDAEQLGCSSLLEKHDQIWVVTPLTSNRK